MGKRQAVGHPQPVALNQSDTVAFAVLQAPPIVFTNDRWVPASRPRSIMILSVPTQSVAGPSVTSKDRSRITAILSRH